MALERYVKLGSYVKKYWVVALLMVVSVTMLTVLRVVVPVLLGDAVTDIVSKKPLTNVLLISVEIIIVSGISSLFQFGLGYGGQALGQKIIYDMRNKIFTAIQNQSFSFHDRNETGQLMARATGDVEAVRRLLAFGSAQLLGNIFLMGGVILSLFFLNFELALVVVLVFPLLLYSSWRFSQTQAPHWRYSREHYGALNSVLQQNITGMRIVRAFSAEKREIDKFEEKNEAYRDDIVKAAAIRSFYTPLLTLIVSLDTGLLYLFGGGQVLAGSMQIGALIAAANLLGLLLGPVRFLGQLILLWQNGMAGFDRILEVTEASVEVKDRPNAVDLDSEDLRGSIKFANVKFGYTKDRPILKGVSLEINPGEVVAFLGSTGSGKTTVANLIPRFYDVTSGSVLIDGVDVQDVKLKSLRSNIGIVSPDIFLFSATIRENISFGKPDASLEEVVAAAKVARADEFIERFLEKYDTLVGERGITLSGGQKQRVAIARTLITDPKILILDDSLSSVDVETEYAIQDALKAVVGGRTTIIITQRLSTLRLADRIVVFDEGRIVEDGKHETLLQANGAYARLYRAQLAPQEQKVEQSYLRDDDLQPQEVENFVAVPRAERDSQSSGR
jgi:ATP-binding cassette subfamily B protein